MSDGIAVTGVISKYGTRNNGDLVITVTIDESQIPKFTDGFKLHCYVALVRMAEEHGTNTQTYTD